MDLFDLGLPAEIAESAERVLHPITRRLFSTRSLPNKSISNQLSKAGFSLDSVKYIFLSHLHFDHIGDLNEFKDATIVIGEDTDLDHLSKLDGFDPEPIHDLNKLNLIQTLSFHRGTPLATFEKAIDYFKDGSIQIIKGGGHVDGSIALLIQLQDGPVLLSGDEVVHFDWLNHDDVQRISKNPNRIADIRNRIRMLIQLAPEVVLIPGHDLSKLPLNLSMVTWLF